MNQKIFSNIAIMVGLCMWLNVPAATQDLSEKQSPPSLLTLEQESLKELEKEKQRLTRLLADRDPFDGCSDAWETRMEAIARARLMGEIVRMGYLLKHFSGETTRSATRDLTSVKFGFPEDPLRLTVVQRSSKPIPGFHGAVNVKIGDITGGQVLLEILSDESLRPLVDTVSVQAGDAVSFEVQDTRCYVSVIELRNFLMGDDFAVLEISTTPPSENTEIEELLATIQTSGLVFIRNGEESDASTAADHLRNKWRIASPPIETAETFINRIASQSSVTGEPYYVKLADGSRVQAANWLRRQLQNIRENRKH
jgi:hypothetical protein